MVDSSHEAVQLTPLGGRAGPSRDDQTTPIGGGSAYKSIN